MADASGWTGPDVKYMRRALALAAQARGRTSPNPLVGAVIVQGGEVVGEGYHQAAGGAHAEFTPSITPGQPHAVEHSTLRLNRAFTMDGHLRARKR